MAEKIFQILVVDDLEDWQKTLGGLLRESGYDVTTVGSGLEAIIALEAKRYDLAIIDVHLDVIDESNIAGLDLATNIKHRWPLIKVIFITGYPNPDILNRAMEPQRGLGGQSLAEDFIKKEQIHNLIKSVQRILGR